MIKDERDVLETLEAELNFIEKGGYGRSVKTPWQPTSVFQDSPSCLSFSDPQRTRPCGECLLMDFVPPEGRRQYVPCHHIQVGDAGETVESLGQSGDQQQLEEAVKTWLRAKIRQVENERAAQ